MKRPGIDGGPLGFLTWTIPMLAGSLAYDCVRARSGQARSHAPTVPPSHGIGRLFTWGVVLMVLGYGLACLNLILPPVTQYEWEKVEEWGRKNAAAGNSALLLSHPPADPRDWLVQPPFVPPSRPVSLWTMSQRAGSVSYQTFSTGLSLALFALFVLACDLWRLRLGVFTTLGTNALAGYVIHMLVEEPVKDYAPRDSPLWYALAAFAVFFGICYLFLRHMEKNRLFLRL
jgi:predicted acyltransferase